MEFLGSRRRRVPLTASIWALTAILAGCGEKGAKPVSATASTPYQVQETNPALGLTQKIDSGDRLANVSASALAAPTDSGGEQSAFRFEEVTKAAGIDFRHVSGMTPQKLFPTANGSGVAVFDYDGDGRMDLYFATATALPVGSAKTGPNRLFRNMGDGTFKDMTAASGLGFEGYCHGIIAADLDNDGDQDVIVCNFGPNVLFLNNGDGTFRDVSKAAGISVPGWSNGGAVIDYDDDGDLDVYITNYGDWDLDRDGKMKCTLGEPSPIQVYCSPMTVRTTKHFFYRNDGLRDGIPHFTDVLDEFLVDADGKPIPGRRDGHGFGAVSADVDGDGKIDLYVANDMNPNFLFLNQGGGKFRDAGEASGAAFNEKGAAQSGMGVDCEDVTGDGKPELFVTNFQAEYNTVYENLGHATFYDQTPAFGMAADSLPYVGWGCLLGDFDNDGWPDAFVANGHVDDNRPKIPYAEPPLLHRNVGLNSGPEASRKFRRATKGAGPYFASGHVGRGAAFGDLDDDGRLDIVVNQKDDLPGVVLNRTPRGDNHWIRLKLRGTKSNRDAVGARIEVKAAGRTIYRQRKGGMSMQSSHDPRVLIGIGTATKVQSLVVKWPSGAPDSVLEGLDVDKTYEIVEPAAARPAA